MAIKKLPLRLHPSAIASRHQWSIMASYTAPKSVKSRGSTKAVKQGQTAVLGSWRCKGPWEGRPTRLLMRLLMCFSCCLLQLPEVQGAFSMGDFCFHLLCSTLALNLWLAPRTASTAMLSPPVALLPKMPAVHNSPLLITLQLSNGTSSAFRPQGTGLPPWVLNLVRWTNLKPCPLLSVFN